MCSLGRKTTTPTPNTVYKELHSLGLVDNILTIFSNANIENKKIPHQTSFLAKKRKNKKEEKKMIRLEPMLGTPPYDHCEIYVLTRQPLNYSAKYSSENSSAKCMHVCNVIV